MAGVYKWIKETHELDEQSLGRGVSYLVGTDADLARIERECGRPPLWKREQGFGTLIKIILEQQVSLASAQAAYNRLLAAASPPDPQSFLSLDDATLKHIGFSRQKNSYGRQLARAVLEGRLDLDALPKLTDEEVRAALTSVKGIGPWTAEIYLLMALGRPDAWPAGDLALALAVQSLKGLGARPTASELEHIGEAWKPLKAVAARLLWHYYLSRAGTRRKKIESRARLR
jgi:DNA-3-methyladenine glycosylase II